MRDDGTFDHRVVFDLGKEPTQFFELYEDFIILFKPELLEAVSAETDKGAEIQLENLLWDFLPIASRQRLKLFQGRGSGQVGPLSQDEKNSIATQIHIFDRRRLYYLRYGAVDQSRLSRLHEKCCRPLLGQSRDEREYYFRAEEQALEPGMYLQYVYAIFNLQKFFKQSFAPWLPEALAIETMGEHFEKEICQLQRDKRFWQKTPDSERLHPHLARYLVMFFDYLPTPRSFFDDFARSFRANHRTFRWPEKKSSVSPEKISEIFGENYEKLKTLSKTELNKLYRKKAMELHPDKGGDHERFVELSTVYTDLLKSK